MKILIYEKDSLFRKKLQIIIQIFLNNQQLKTLEIIHIDTQDSVEKLLITLPQQNIYIISLEKGGLVLAQTIRKFDPLGFVILLSQQIPDYQAIFDTKVEAMALIKKDVDFDHNLIDCFNHIAQRYKRIRQVDDIIEIPSHPNNITLFQNEIIYFETSSVPHKIWLFGKYQEIEFYSNLTEIEKLSRYFIRVSRSIIVNINNINFFDISKSKIYLSNQEIIRCSDWYKHDFLNRYKRYKIKG